MRLFITLIFIFLTSFCYSQSEGGREPTIHIGGDVGAREPGNPNAGGNGGNNANGNASTSGDATADKPGKSTLSQPLVDALITLMNDFFGTTFFSSLFSPSSLPGDVMKQELINQIDDLATKADIDGRKADAEYARQLKEDLMTKANILYTLDFDEKEMAAALLLPIIKHNVPIRIGNGTYPGMSITVPGTVKNAQKHGTGELIVRFYMPNGDPLFANANEPYYRDLRGLVVAGSGPIQILNDHLSTVNYTMWIPYYALNLPPTNGMQQYNLRARATVYVKFNQVTYSGLTPLTVSY